MNGAEQLEQVVPRLGEVVAAVRPEHMALQTPCAEWTTRDLLNHVVGGAEMFAGAFGGGPLRDISGRLPDVVGDDPGGAFQAAAERFGEAAQQTGAMERVLPLPFGSMTGETFLRFAAFDLLVHSWDLATTIGRELDVPTGLVGEIHTFARATLDPWERDGVNFRDEVRAPASASPLDRLIAFSGRRP